MREDAVLKVYSTLSQGAAVFVVVFAPQSRREISLSLRPGIETRKTSPNVITVHYRHTSGAEAPPTAVHRQSLLLFLTETTLLPFIRFNDADFDRKSSQTLPSSFLNIG